MKTALIMIGVSGSGKTTVRNNFITKFNLKDVSVFSLDDCRLTFALMKIGSTVPYDVAYKTAVDHQKEFDEHVNRTWASSLKSEFLFVDNMNLTRKSRARWIAEARQKQFGIVAVQVMVPLSVALERQSTRTDKSVPLSVVEDGYYRQQEVLLGSEVDQLLVISGTNPVLPRSLFTFH